MLILLTKIIKLVSKKSIYMVLLNLKFTEQRQNTMNLIKSSTKENHSKQGNYTKYTDRTGHYKGYSL